MSQILNLKDHELDALADFLGHDIRVHRQFYRLSEDTVQVAKISKLLLELESGRLARHKGKTLDEIQVDEKEEIQMDKEEEEHGLSDDEDDPDKKDEETVDPVISSIPESLLVLIKRTASPGPKEEKQVKGEHGQLLRKRQ